MEMNNFLVIVKTTLSSKLVRLLGVRVLIYSTLIVY